MNTLNRSFLCLREARGTVRGACAAAAIAAAATLLSAAPTRVGAADAAPPAGAPAGQGASAAPADPDTTARESVHKALEYLKAQQKSDGSWQRENDPPGVTAIVLEALVRSGEVSPKDPAVARGYEKLLSFQKDNGGVYKDTLANYNTSLAVCAVAAAKEPAYHERLDKAIRYLHAMQWDQNTPATPAGKKVEDDKDPWFGGFSYDGKTRPDLSNTTFTLDALHDAGASLSDPAMKNVQVFMTRCQNRSESNTFKFASDDGGAIYTPANGEGQSAAGNFVDPTGQRRCRSYGAMTYALIKGMIYSGVEKDDPRLKAAHDWIGKNWSVDKHPGMELNQSKDPLAGLFYYYHAMARALHAWGDPSVTDARGRRHDWRAELTQKLASTQTPDGSWVGEKRWMENNPVLATAEAVLALEEVREDLKARPAPAK